MAKKPLIITAAKAKKPNYPMVIDFLTKPLTTHALKPLPSGE
ncbi:hypothetical protein [Emticicia fontis]